MIKRLIEYLKYEIKLFYIQIMSNVKSNNDRNVVRLLLDVKNNRCVISIFVFN